MLERESQALLQRAVLFEVCINGGKLPMRCSSEYMHLKGGMAGLDRRRGVITFGTGTRSGSSIVLVLPQP